MFNLPTSSQRPTGLALKHDQMFYDKKFFTKKNNQEMIFIVMTICMMHLINMRGRQDILKQGVRGMSHCGWKIQFCESISLS